MGQLWYMRSVVDRNVIMRRMTVYEREWSALRPDRLTPRKEPRHYRISRLEALQISLSLTSDRIRPTICLSSMP